MALPKLKTPEFDTVIPSTGEKIKFRPFLVGEQKILYMALESGQTSDAVEAMMRILETCILTPGVVVRKLASYDIEFLFMKLRAKSVNEVIEVGLKHSDPAVREKCDVVTKVAINVDEIEVETNPKHVYELDLGDGIGLKMNDPSAQVFVDYSDVNGPDAMVDMLYDCVENAWDENQVYDDFTKKELSDFIDHMSDSQIEKVHVFFSTLPTVKKEVEYECKECKVKEKITLEGLQGFFT